MIDPVGSRSLYLATRMGLVRFVMATKELCVDAGVAGGYFYNLILTRCSVHWDARRTRQGLQCGVGVCIAAMGEKLEDDNSFLYEDLRL